MSRITAIGPDGLSAGAATTGIVRESAFDLAGATLMRTRAEPFAA